jgi:hypothetical protein
MNGMSCAVQAMNQMKTVRHTDTVNDDRARTFRSNELAQQMVRGMLARGAAAYSQEKERPQQPCASVHVARSAGLARLRDQHPLERIVIDASNSEFST